LGNNAFKNAAEILGDCRDVQLIYDKNYFSTCTTAHSRA